VGGGDGKGICDVERVFAAHKRNLHSGIAATQLGQQLVGQFQVDSVVNG